MKTFNLRKEDVKEKWYLVDATDKIVGRLAGKVAKILTGKNKPTFTPGVDTKNYVVVINSEKVRISGKKAETKEYKHHSFYIGGLKTETYKKLIETNPGKILEHAINGMLPKNKLRPKMLGRLRIFKGESHPHSAQKLEILN